VRALDVKPMAIVLEPFGRNTAPAVAVAAIALTASEPDALMLVMPSDHAISDLKAFYGGIDRAAKLVTFGVEADRPETGYGYIKRGAPLKGVEGVFELGAFVEKPDKALAE